MKADLSVFAKRGTPRNWSLHFPSPQLVHFSSPYITAVLGQGLSNTHVMAQENLVKDLLITTISFDCLLKCSGQNPDQIANVKPEKWLAASSRVVFQKPTWWLKFIAKSEADGTFTWQMDEFMLVQSALFLPPQLDYICKNDSSTQWVINFKLKIASIIDHHFWIQFQLGNEQILHQIFHCANCTLKLVVQQFSPEKMQNWIWE